MEMTISEAWENLSNVIQVEFIGHVEYTPIVFLVLIILIIWIIFG